MRAVFAAALAAIAFAAVPEVAAAGVFEGRFRGVPNSQFDLTFVREDGKRQLSHLVFTEAPIICEDGQGDASGDETEFSTPIVRHREFDARHDEGTTHMRVRGELSREGKAVGVFKERLFTGALGNCATGRLEWVAHRT